MTKIPGVSNLEFVREEDFVEYYIFPKIPDNLQAEEGILRKLMLQIRNEINAIVKEKSLERSYLWHKDEFQLQIRLGTAEERLLNEETNPEEQAELGDLPPHFHGVTHYGDNISDEWFIVYLLAEITRARGDCIARVSDSDGEFLLIEAADSLPDWASPENCEQRVYLVNGCLQLLQNSSQQEKPLTMAMAVQRIRLNPTLYRCSREIQSCIDSRLKEYQIAQPHFSIHRQVLELPVSAAQLLKQQPRLLSSAVRAFCERDSLDVKALRTMRYFPPEATRLRTNVRFTRCLYAMLSHQQYLPEKRLGWNLADPLKQPERYKEQLLGVKLASGLEILASQAKRVENQQLEEMPQWRAYVRSLQSKGYFKNNLEGSAEYQELLNKAKDYFKGNQARFRTASQAGAEILDILLHPAESASEELRDEENNLQPSDSDEWLNISAEDLDSMLQDRYGPKKLYKPNGQMNAEEFTKQLAEFLDRQSNYEGIEHRGLEEPELDSDDDEPPPQAKSSTGLGGKVKKNPSMRKACQRNSLIQSEEPDSTHVRNFLDFVIPEDNWDSTSEMSDYADEEDMERNLNSLSGGSSVFPLDRQIQSYMEQMDRELAQTSVGKSFTSKQKKTAAPQADEDDFDDIEDFEPININVNTLRNMMDSYQSQVGGSGPVSNLFSAMGVGMSASEDQEPKDISESAV
ncbi:protein ecdysoneless [Drosophila takahashii]|uniref:protein ecdysoneless n=1 Tax=Drosophila takahashii TaxID=29030 RepID=UPI001CF8B03D|nr:protein ecdysoneless [Drosophila takahashii]